MPDKTIPDHSATNVADIKSAIVKPLDINVKEGSTLANGQTIEKIFSKSPNYIIYSVVGEFDFHYRYNIQNADVREGVRKFEFVMKKYKEIRKGVGDDRFDSIAISTLRTIFQADSVEVRENSISDLEKQLEALKPIKAVIGRGKGFVVWINDADKTQYRHTHGLPEVEYSVAAYTRIKSLAAALLPESKQRSFNRRLGAALVEAFKTKPGKDIDRLFIPLEEYIQRCISNDLRTQYLVVTSTVTIILICISYLLHQLHVLPSFLHSALIAVSGGYLGTFISVFERSKSLSVGDHESTKLILSQGTLRVILGGVFGFIAYAAALSGMAFTIFKDTTASLILLGVAAGFSERLIPDLIQGFSSSKETASK